ncbi:hypothetical protein D1AOALGA4SA_12367 [Olavius algarvensis Delta 1 endosymbiont]|nr:hypothetical protein D1AOALGA4SA_12367 [Olavius algarvensis Delta 1 endosymbiont]
MPHFLKSKIRNLQSKMPQFLKSKIRNLKSKIANVINEISAKNCETEF